MEEQNINPTLKLFFPLVDCIADLFGSNCEVVLHDISDVEHSIVKISNGHITGRKIGNPMTDVGLEMIKKADKGLTLLGNYNPKTKTGKLLKSNAINIRDLNNKLVGILCINLDVSNLAQIDQEIQDFYKAEDKKQAKVEEEYFGTDVWSIIQEIIEKIINEKGKPVHNLAKEDRLEIIKELDKKGIFLIKGAILQVSKSLGISSPTIYKYLEETRFASNEKQLLE